MTTSTKASAAQESELDRILGVRLKINTEMLVFGFLIVVALVTRLYGLEARVMSHDESLHTYYSWQLVNGRGYQHTPLTHGPLQFHLVAFSYFMFGDSDATSRIPVALAGVASIALLYFFRRWLGKWGAVVSASLLLISPYMLYYQRYVRNEALVVLLALLMVWSAFRYFERRETRWLILLAASISLHFAAKETSFIYVAQLALFLGVFLAWDLLRRSWQKPTWKILFTVGLVMVLIGAGVSVFTLFRARAMSVESIGETGQPANPLSESLTTAGRFPTAIIGVGLVVTILGLLLLINMLLMNFGQQLRTDFPALDLLLVIGTLTLPQMAALPATVLGWDPLAYQDPDSFSKTLIVVAILVGISVAFGLIWDWRRWLIVAGVFFTPYVILFTTMFTNGQGLASGLVGSLGYWIVQHGVERGGQPWYYYFLVQIPIYEYLPAIGTLIAAGMGLSGLWKRIKMGDWNSKEEATGEGQPRFPALPYLAFWTVSSLILYSFAGERMPWLTVHIALPMILLSGWAIGKLIESTDWKAMWADRGGLISILLLVGFIGTLRAIASLLGSQPPFQGSDMQSLQATSDFLTPAIIGVGAILAIIFLTQTWRVKRIVRLGVVLFLGLLFLLTMRTAFRASYVNYDNATEYLVYAHSARGVKTALAQVEELSLRTTDSLAIDIGYDNDIAWPFTWYLRNYSKAHYFGANPGREITNYPVIVAGNDNWSKVEPILGRRYFSFEYIRMWWPMQDYFGLNWDSIREALVSAELREALWKIWLDRDYTAYGAQKGKDFSLKNWSPSDRMRLYLRKDIAGMVWDYGAVEGALSGLSLEDPYEARRIELAAASVFGESGSEPGQFSAPRSIAIAADGSLYVADSRNHRIQHLDTAGNVLHVWGTFSDAPQGEGREGTFHEPWSVAVAPDGSVYVADTWNHRIQHFSATGEFIGTFGEFGQGQGSEVLWGPRAIAIDDRGRLFVADTGNKRVAVYDSDENLLTQFGGLEYGFAQLNEPVGLAVVDKKVYVADTWNQRIQVFEEVSEGTFRAVNEWPIDGWYGESLENKPYLAILPEEGLCVTDPEGYRILCFTLEGEYLLSWGEYGVGGGQFGLPSGLVFSPDGNLWVADAGNNRIMQFQPEISSANQSDEIE